MSVWFATPSIRPVEQADAIFQLWRDRGYKLALLRQGEPIAADIFVPADAGTYLGVPVSINKLVSRILKADPNVEWIVHGGDDYEPDLNNEAEDIAKECGKHFGGTFGVMQPTGDRYGGGYIDTAAASGWMGAEYCQRMYAGRGPGWEGYRHMYWDAELQSVAELMGVFWQTQHLTQYHRHWTREANPQCPDFLKEVTFGEQFLADQRLYEHRKLLGFPGHDPL